MKTSTRKVFSKKEYGPTPGEKLCERLIQVIEQGVSPWRKEWNTVNNGCHRNIITGEKYHGANPMMLEFQAVFGNYSLPLWCGAAQAKAKKWFPKKGSHGSYVLRPQLNSYDKLDENGKPVLNSTGEVEKNSWVSYKTACVFNVEALQGEGLQEEIDKLLGIQTVRLEHERIAAAENTLMSWGVKKNFRGDRAFYVPSIDEITVPDIQSFHSPEAFYATLAHEEIHSTGHESRLGRKLGTTKESDDYAREELVAEMGAFILCNRLEIGSNVENHAAYLEGWLKVLKQGPKTLFKAVSDATKAANLILPENHDLT